ncbi:hypothetical protein MNBD_ACTINO01-2430, partial [hydrothermal vent metagenome]
MLTAGGETLRLELWMESLTMARLSTGRCG